MAVPVLVFDLDGTLIDTLPDLTATLNAILKHQGLNAVAPNDVRSMAGQGAKMLLKRGLQANEVSADEALIDRLFDDFIDHYSNHIAIHSAPFPGAIAALNAFSEAGWQLAICTNKLTALAKKLLSELNLSEHFVAICGADACNARKPDPFHLTHTIELAGGMGANAVMVGDTIADVEAAKRANIPVIGVDFGYSQEPMINLQPDCIISHFNQLADAVFKLQPNLPKAIYQDDMVSHKAFS